MNLTRSLPRLLPLALLMALVAAPPARAVPIVGYELQLSGDTNVPEFRLTNQSNAESAAEIEGFTITIGDTAYNYDFAAFVGQTGGVGGTLIGLDAIDDGLRSDLVQYTFTGFDPGDVFQFEADVDLDASPNTVLDYRVVLFNNGAAPNAAVTVQFSTGQDLTLTLPDGTPTDTVFTFSQSQVVPEPGSLALLILGSALGLRARRRLKA